MFRSNSYLDTLGASDLLIDFVDKAIAYAVTHIDPPLEEDEYDLSNVFPYLFVILFMILVKHTAAVRQLFQCGAVIGNAGEAGRGKAKGAFFQIGFFTDPVYDK